MYIIIYIPSQGILNKCLLYLSLKERPRLSLSFGRLERRSGEKGFYAFIPHFDLKSYPLADYQEVGVMNAAHTVANAPEKLHQCWLINYLNMYVNLREACAKDI